PDLSVVKRPLRGSSHEALVHLGRNVRVAIGSAIHEANVQLARVPAISDVNQCGRDDPTGAFLARTVDRFVRRTLERRFDLLSIKSLAHGCRPSQASTSSNVPSRLSQTYHSSTIAL